MRDVVLVTGGFGYLGGRVATALTATGDLAVRLGTRRSRPEPPPWLPEADVVTMTMASDSDLAAACRGVRYIVHLAAANEIESAAYPEMALEVTTCGTIRLLRVARAAGVERVIYLSTIHVYGAPLTGEIAEKNLPRPVHPYAITHRAAEDFILAANDRRDLQGIVVRLSNGLGAPTHASMNRWTLVANDLCLQAVRDRELVLKSSGLQERDFIPLSDVELAVRHLLSLPAQACGDGVFNLGGECTLRIIDLAHRIADRCQHVLGFIPRVRRADRDPQPTPNSRLQYNINKLKATGFELQGKLDDEIDATLRLCQKAFSSG